MIDIDFAMLSGTFICGMRRHGKTNWGFHVADMLKKEGCFLTVFDSSQQWMEDSNMDYKQTITEGEILLELYPIRNIVYDLAGLYQDTKRLFIMGILKRDFQLAVRCHGFTIPHIYVFEECQLMLPSGKLRSAWYEEAMRLITEGGNFNMNYMLLTQRPATVDTTAISQCGQSYWGYLQEQNDLRKAKNWLGKDAYPKDETN